MRSLGIINSYGTQEEEDTLNTPLTKSAHRNPELHKRGDSLPESLLEYQEGSASLEPDIGGLSPKMLRDTQEATQPGSTQTITSTSDTLLTGNSIAITCPPQAINPEVRVFFYTRVNISTPAGAPANFCQFQVKVDGINVMSPLVQAPSGALGATAFRQNASLSKKIPINPGQTITISAYAARNNTAAPQQTYDVSLSDGITELRAELYY